VRTLLLKVVLQKFCDFIFCFPRDVTYDMDSADFVSVLLWFPVFKIVDRLDSGVG